MRSPLVYEEALPIRARELTTWASSSRLDDVERSTTEGADISIDTTDGVFTNDEASSEKPKPPAY